MAPHVLTVGIVFMTSLLAFYIIISTRHKERMTMIDRGIAPSDTKINSKISADHPLQTLKWGLLIFGVGVGFVISLIIESIPGYHVDDDIQPALMLLCGGAGLIVYYFIAAKKVRTEKDNNRQ